jgi:hypothetical protein
MRTFFSRVAITIAAISAFGACVNNQPANLGSSNSATSPSPAAQSSPSTVKVQGADENAMPVTLPVLDAFFADETFAGELKTNLQLTDQQVDQLRTVAREETSKLRETDTDDYSGSTAAARAHAAKEIEAILGADKAQGLAAFLRALERFD